MELSPGRKGMLFVVLLILLAGLGIYLAGSGRSHGSPGAAQSPGSATGGGPVPSPSAAMQKLPAAAVAPTPLPAPVTTKNANIYDWLPFTQQDLDAAANV